MKIAVFDSLRGRYALVAVIVAAIVVGVAYVSYVRLNNVQGQTSENTSARQQLLEHSRLIRDAVWNTRESLAAFLLSPNNNSSREDIYNYLDNAKNHTNDLLMQPWIIQYNKQASVETLSRNLDNLHLSIDELVGTRLNINKQYPAMALARESMLPLHKVFYTSAEFAIQEFYEEPPTKLSLLSQQRFIKARHLWTQMISDFRMYLANRVGSFAEKVLHIQEEAVITQYNDLKKLLNKLQRMDDKGQLDIQGSTSLTELNEASQHWYETFEQVKEIHSKGEWRTDKKLIQTNIKPYMEEIWQLLITLDQEIEMSVTDDLTALSRAAGNQIQDLWLFTILSLTLISLGFFALELSVLKPIASIGNALKSASNGNLENKLPEGGVQETKDLVSAFSSMHKQVVARQTALEYHALHDALTNLGNRNRLNEHLKIAINTANRNQETFALLMLDLDRFKEVNDTLGHPVGDQLLIEVGVRLAGLLRETDTIARFGGDEFAILLPTAHETQATKVAEKIAAALAAPFHLGEQQLYTSASIGIASFPQHGHDASTLIQHADIAMYVAKKSTTGWALYDSVQDRHSVGRLGLMAELRNAVNKNNLELHYQPKRDTITNEIHGAEALLRWNHPEHGFIPPEEIVALAEQTGFIHELSAWVLENAIQQANEWVRSGIQLNIAVNLSAQNLQDENIVKHVRELLAKTGFPPKHLTLEITENAMMAEPDHAVTLLGHLSAMGIRIAVDDFGTGFSSLGYLKKLPVNELKIDKSFVIDMVKNDNDAVIVRSTIDLAHNLGLKVVAEGVEDSDTMDLLKILRCDTLQGYLISKALPAQDFLSWLKSQKSQAKLASHPSNRSA